MAQPANMMNPMASLMGGDVLKQQYELEQNKRFADIMMQQALMEQPQGQMVSGHYVPPSPVQGLAQLLKAYVGRRSSDLIPEKQAAIADAQNQKVMSMFGLGGAAAPAQARDLALSGGAVQGDVGPTNTNAARMNNVAQGTGAAYPLIGNDPRLSYLTFAMGGPQAYAKALVDQQAPSGELKALIAAGYQPGSPQYRAAAAALANKNAYIAPTVVSEGGSLVPAGANRPSFIAPKGGISISPTTGQSSVLPGYTGAVSQINQAEAFGTGLGKAQTSPSTRIDIPTGNTVTETLADTLNLQQPSAQGGAQTRGGPTVTGLNPVVVETNKKINQDWLSNNLEPVRLSGRAASGALDNIKVLKSINLQTGFGTDAKLAGANLLASLGVKDAEKFATSGQVFQSKVFESLVDTLAKQKGPQTETDAKNIQKTFAQLKNTPQANQFLLDVAEAKALQDRRKMGFYEKAMASNDPRIRGNLPSISENWSKISGSVFDIPLKDAAGNVYTLGQKYGIQ